MDFKAYLENPQLLHEGTEPNRSYVIPLPTGRRAFKPGWIPTA